VLLLDNWRYSSDRFGDRFRDARIVVLLVNDGAFLVSVLLAIVFLGRNVWMGLDAGHDGFICFGLVVRLCPYLCSFLYSI
jgi:hypothetical protein